MRILIETIPHDQQRYNTCGDWTWNSDKDGFFLHVKVSRVVSTNVKNAFLAEVLVGVHELVEAVLCYGADIDQSQVDNFDTDPSVQRDAKFLNVDIGDHPLAPYRDQHCIATGIERILCASFGLSWSDYEEALNKLTDSRK